MYDSPSDHSIGVLLGLQRNPTGSSIVSIGKHEVSPLDREKKRDCVSMLEYLDNLDEVEKA